MLHLLRLELKLKYYNFPESIHSASHFLYFIVLQQFSSFDTFEKNLQKPFVIMGYFCVQF